ncbi:MAG: polymerase III, subunit gamma/tau protein [Candidatus Woesebacteria bacterium GW2011_GWB1_45_5]|uniref:DNA polymerase III subunit gamma/tau n=1 Tax=Candidatus Woesebacteria bacterium GW2011_GWB1_45_5 TaxID=1618581 RepID=A0A0G1MLZ6_9BACT|nr:MAG: polymerase III, subunit gamma/tau protein [Candidatus Woesebacteria bacterium GW2011_GWB1_45_5]
MTLYLKYRPKNLDELDLADVSESLKKIVKSGKMPHAFLFAGPKGTGKTSAARILAKIINCESKKSPCNKCEQCVSITKGSNLDVIEMDAASHRGIDDIRVLRDAVKLAPTKAKKKIYIIDEAHMLTTEASNALLTNAEKLIGTIRSRTTLIAFRKATPEETVHSLTKVVKGEKMKIEEEVIQSIAKAANGSFRDAVKILEQVSLEGKQFLEKGSVSGIEEFTDLLYKKDVNGLLLAVRRFVAGGVSTESLLTETLAQIEKDIVEDAAKRTDLTRLAELLIEANRQLSDSPVEELPLEIAVIKWCRTGQDKSETIKIEDGTVKTDDEEDETKESKGDGEKKEEKTLVDLENLKEISSEIWQNILLQVKPINASIEALLRAARPVSYDGKTLTLGVYYRFHKERLEDNTHRRVLEDIVGRVLQSPARIVCTLVEPPPRKIVEEIKTEAVLTEGKDADIIKVAEEIFGS